MSSKSNFIRGCVTLWLGLSAASVGSVWGEEISSQSIREIQRILNEGVAQGVRGERQAVEQVLQYGPRGIPILVDLLQSPSFRIRRLAARVLRERPDVAAIPALSKALDDSDPSVALLCREALVALGIPALRYLNIRKKTGLSARQILSVKQVEAEYYLEWVLAQLRSMFTREGTIGLYQGQFREIEEKGEPALDALLVLVEAREHFPHTIRYLAAGALAEIASPRSRDRLHKAYRRGASASRERPIQNVLTVALARVGDDSPLKRRLEWYRWQIGIHSGRRDRWHYELGYLLYLAGSLDSAIEHFEVCLELRPAGHATAAYNLSNIYSRLGRVDKAFEYLEMSIDYGFSDLDWMERDTDLDPIREDPRYMELTSRLQRLRVKQRDGLGR